MREFLRRGGRDQTGLDDLARRVAEKRRELLQRHNLDGTLQEVRELLDHAVLEERKQLARDVDMDDADRAFREMQLENLPSSHRGGGQRAERLRLAEPRGARGLREDQGPARPRAARPAVRRHEAGARERHRRGPRRDQRDARRPQRAAREAPPGRGHPGGLRRVHGQARRLLPGEPAERRRAARRAGPAGGGRAADAQLDDAGAARRADAALRAGVRVAAADAVARPARRQPPVAAARRGLGRLRAVRRRAGARPRRRHRRAPGPRRPRRPRRAALPVVRRRPAWTTSTSTSWPASSATRPPSTPAPCSGSSRRCATPATSSAAPTASSG